MILATRSRTSGDRDCRASLRFGREGAAGADPADEWVVSSAAPAIVLDPLCLCTAHAGDPGAANRGPAAVVLVVGGHVADPGAQANGVVLAGDPGELVVDV